MKNPTELIKMFLLNSSWAIREPKLCKAAFLARRITQDEFTVAVLHALIQFPGDWRAVAEFLNSTGQPKNRVDKFRKWAAEITSPARRGFLLTWKGGAS